MNTERKLIYADNAAHTLPYDCAIAAMTAACLPDVGNPSGVHRMSRNAARILFSARGEVADCFGCKRSEVYFTSSGTEADNWAVVSAARLGLRNGKNRLLISSIEHHAVVNAALSLRTEDVIVEFIPCLPSGVIDTERLGAMLGNDVALVSVMLANNETGIVQPIEQVVKLCCSVGCPVHCDAVAAAGHISVRFVELGVDMLTLSAHKLHGAVGAGALLVREGLLLPPLLLGGSQESNMRAGTEALPAIAAMGAASKRCIEQLNERSAAALDIRSRLEQRLSAISGVVVIGADSDENENIRRLPGTVCALFPNDSGERIALMLDREGICTSSGAACTTGSDESSHVLRAMGISETAARGAVRFSFDDNNTPDDAGIIADAVDKVLAAKK